MPRRLALWLTLPTGFAGLVYGVTWEQSLATLLGSHSEAAAAVLALFLGGLAAGYALFGRLARRRPEPAALLRAYGLVEIGIGVYALAFPELLSAARAVSARLPALADGPAFALDVALSALLIAPPATAMGATIPLLTQALPRDAGAATRIHARPLRVPALLLPAAPLLLPPWSAERLSSGAYRIRHPTPMTRVSAGAFFASLTPSTLLFHDDDPSDSITVKEFINGAEQTDRNLATNGKSEGSVRSGWGPGPPSPSWPRCPTCARWWSRRSRPR